MIAGLEWIRHGETITRSIECIDFMTAIELVGKVAVISEKMDHHPDIEIRWRTVTFSLTTHSTGTITELDLMLARQIDALFES